MAAGPAAISSRQHEFVQMAFKALTENFSLTAREDVAERISAKYRDTKPTLRVIDEVLRK
jgi:hypothetical protein